MTFRIPFAAIAIIFACIAAYQYFSVPLEADKLFAQKRTTVEGEAYRWSPSRGAPMIRIVTPKGGEFYTDCLVAADICERSAANTSVKIRGEFMHIQHAFYWPARLVIGDKRSIDEQSSRMAYELYRAQTGQLYRLWLAMALAFAILCGWLGRRQML